jgi:hypothetical protein
MCSVNRRSEGRSRYRPTLIERLEERKGEKPAARPCSRTAHDQNVLGERAQSRADRLSLSWYWSGEEIEAAGELPVVPAHRARSEGAWWRRAVEGDLTSPLR